MSNELDGFCLRPLQLKKQVPDTMFLSVEYFSDWPLAFDWPLSKFFMAYCQNCSDTKLWHMGRSLLSSPFFVSTSAAFLFLFQLWFACILAFSFELRVNFASLELTFGCFDCFVRRLFPLLRLPFAAVFFLPAVVPVPKLQFHDYDRCPRTSIPPKNWYFN